MRCIWCSNPESLEPYPRLGVYPARCLSREKCGKCLDLYLHEAVEACPQNAKVVWGEKKTLPDLMKVIVSDRRFFERSGGGVTLNGGEVMMQWEFAQMLLKKCKESGIHTCVETALHCPQEHMEAVYENTDLVIADIKHMDSAAHMSITGVGNEMILSNLRRTVELGKKLIIRTPVVPGYNGDELNIRKIGEFIRDELGSSIISWELLPFRRLGTEKYESLMLPYPMENYEPLDRVALDNEITRLADMLVTDYDLPVAPVLT